MPVSILRWYGDALRALSPRGRVAFAAFCAECVLQLWDQPQKEPALKRALKLAWDAADGHEVPASAVEHASEALARVYQPDSDIARESSKYGHCRLEGVYDLLRRVAIQTKRVEQGALLVIHGGDRGPRNWLC